MAKKKAPKKKAAAKPAAAPADDGIEAAADAAAAADPAADPEPEPEPTPEPEPEKQADLELAPATERKPQTDSKHGEDTAANLAHLAVKKETRPDAPDAIPPAKLSKEAKAKIELRKETRARLDEIRDELVEIEDAKRELIDEQQLLANPVTPPDGMTFIERLRQVQARTTENRERRIRDRLKLLAIGAGKSPLDQAMGAGKRKSPADADAKPDAKE